MSGLKRIVTGCVLLITTCVSLVGSAQELLLSGKGEIVNALYLTPRAAIEDFNYLFISSEGSFVLPQVKPGTKEIQITIKHKKVEFGKLVYDGESSIVRINYNTQGNITEIKKDKHPSVKFQYENGHVIRWYGGVVDSNFPNVYWVEGNCIYNEKGYLEKQYFGHYNQTHCFFEYRTDSKGNIINVKGYNEYTAKAINNAKETYKNDSKGRLVSYSYQALENKNSDYFCRAVEKSWHYSEKDVMTSLMVKKTFNNTITNYEYKFEYGADGNPIQLTCYNHSDVTVITEGWEYKYSYLFYPTPEEQRQQDSIQRRNDSLKKKEDQRIAEQFAQETQRQTKMRELCMPCKFLFDSEKAFASCVSEDLVSAEREIKGLIVKKMQFVSSAVLSRKELRDKNHMGRADLLKICDMCSQMKNVKARYSGAEKDFIEHINNYTENILRDFVSGRSDLNRAYKKSSNTDYSSFLSSYANDNDQNGNKQNDNKTSSNVMEILGIIVSAGVCVWLLTAHLWEK